jgi:radical SAM protein with 4Fe4S-binding SPASM domain
MDKKYRLNDSKVFCMAPWVSINNNPNGDILPCCVSTFQKPFGNLNNNNIEEIWNNEKYKELRKNMLEEKSTSTCERCYKEEEWGSEYSYKAYWNKEFGSKYADLVENSTEADGSLTKMNLYRWDFRFNNLCNLSCVGCGPDLSSSWIDLQQTMWPFSKKPQVYSSKKHKEQFINTIKTQADIVEDIYFAGGEPLLHPEHYEIMNELDRLNRIDKIFFTYSTNLTNLNYKNHNIIDYWKKMKKCKILVSLDEVDPERLYYIRYPSDRDSIINNIKILNETFKDTDKYWAAVPTWSILNLHRIKDMAEYFYKNNLLPRSFNKSPSWEFDFHNIILFGPQHLSITTAPDEWKEHLRFILNEYEQWYKDVLIPLKDPFMRPWAIGVLDNSLEKFRNSLNEKSVDTKSRYDWFKRLDNARQTTFEKTFPELAWYLQ